MTNKFRYSILCLIAIGASFLFFNIDKKYYWYDETFTSLRISGYRESEIVKQVATGQILTPQDLQRFQQPTPEKTLFDTVQGLAAEEPQLTPLYFILARFWGQTFGYSIASIRSLSAIFSLLIFPSIYWLCLELFSSSVTGWLAAGLIAVSPFHVLYAQEARPYSLWTVTILVSTAAFLRSIKLQKKRWWGVYILSLIIGLYSHLLTALVAITHAIYMLVIEKCRWTKNLKMFGLSLVIAGISFLPWIISILISRKTVVQRLQWIDRPITVQSLGINWVKNIAAGYFDINTNSSSPKIYLIPSALIILAILALVGYAFYFLIRHTPIRVWLLVVALVGVTGMAIILPDLTFGGIRSTKARYLIPCYLGIRLAVSYFLAYKIFDRSSAASQIQGKLITLTLIFLGLISCGVSAGADTWWIKEWGQSNPEIARKINQSQRPLVVSNLSNSSYGNLVSLSYLVDPKVRFQLVINPNIPQIPPEFSDIFIYTATVRPESEVERTMNFPVQPLYIDRNQEVWLWKPKK
ncbi:glycosyltransferase family 39 protein [Ancylothrix sp. C2]|uniref:glycosyltransferase family 39 protein n=1 Tax=Ancylothrix sp. D3o TaxID=2953691 RepID=UPI0021BA83B2|nr:glycosyltransferase family 39 protein [Ancylothrix sp. D3o]MCT7950774.1 glycosyltransferase family 39 protein [Ancylothrix sp. D3o]